MAQLPVTQNPGFSATMEQITTRDRAAPDTFNPRYQTLLDNDNYLEQEVEKIEAFRTVNIPASGWSASAPYTQTVPVPGVTEADTPIVSVYLPAGLTAAVVKAQSKAYGMADRAVTGEGTVTLYCYNKKPATDFQIAIKGV